MRRTSLSSKDGHWRRAIPLLLATIPASCSSGSNGAAPASMEAGAPDASLAEDASSGGSGGSHEIDVPPAWKRPASCGGIGETCDQLACAKGTVCQLSNNTCIPDRGPDAGLGCPLARCTDQQPFCLGYRCMSFDEASCYCTGPAASLEPGCGAGPQGLVGACTVENAGCGPGAKSCCDGLGCVKATPVQATCQKTCAQSSDCKTGCCTDVTGTGQLVCADPGACNNPCTKEGVACQGPEQCCSHTCVPPTGNPDFDGCRFSCAKNEDCTSGCCLPTQGGGGICVAALYCKCGGLGAPCAGRNGPCCTGFTCAGLSAVADAAPGSYQCMKSCKVPADCPSKCCALFANSEMGVCEDAANCGGAAQ
jgi:hypothetical protein